VTEPENWLLATKLAALRGRIAAAEPGSVAADVAWRQAEAVVAAAGAGEDAVIALPVLEHELSELTALLAAWDTRAVPLSAWDQAVLKRAMNAYKKRLKLTRGDDEISSNRNPLSRGATSSIVGVRAPEQYSQDIWDRLVAQGRLRDGGDGLLEPAADLPPG